MIFAIVTSVLCFLPFFAVIFNCPYWQTMVAVVCRSRSSRSRSRSVSPTQKLKLVDYWWNCCLV